MKLGWVINKERNDHKRYDHDYKKSSYNLRDRKRKADYKKSSYSLRDRKKKAERLILT